MGWLRWIGRSIFVASLLVGGGAAVNQLIADHGRLAWTAAYFAFIFTVLGVLLDRLPAQASKSEGKTSRRRYLRRVGANVEQMETIGLVTQAEYVLRTRQVYVDVALQPRPVTETVPDGGVGGAPATATGDRKPLASFLTSGSVLAVLGAAGSGKTTLVRYTALELAEQRWWPWQAGFWQPRRIPVLLYLRDHAQAILAEPKQNLAAIAAAAPWLEGVVTEPWLQRRLDRARCVVLLDGLDEVADARERLAVVDWVNTQIRRYPGNTMVVTSRPLGYEANRVAQADVLQVQRFTHSQISEFLSAWFHAIEHRARQGSDPGEIDRIATRGAEDLTRRITAMPALLDLAANPLLLTMIANVHRYRGSLPGSRADLYAEMCQVLLHRRQEAKNLAASHPALDELSGDAKERLMRRLAWKMMLQHQRDIPIADAEVAIGALPHTRTAEPPLTAQVFLDHARRSGLLLEHKPGHYGFAHLSLQEFLAATHVPGDDSRRQILIDHVSDPWWRETILLWAARNDASSIIKACLAAHTVPALSLAYACADEAAEFDHHLREQLTQLLTSAPTDPAEARLLDGVAADRQLHDSTRLDDGTAICATPVSQDLWNRYLRYLHNGNSGASFPASVPTQTAGLEPIRGLWATDLPGFLNWLNSLSDNGPTYRLPAYGELAQLAAWTRTAGGTIWTHDETDEYRLYQPNGIDNPNSLDYDQIEKFASLIINRTSLLLHQATSTELRLPHLLFYGYLTTHSSDLSPTIHNSDLIHTEYQLVHTLDLLATINAVRALDLDHDHTLDLDLDHDRDRARECTINRASELASALVGDLDSALDIVRALDHARTLDTVRSLDHARDIARELDRAREIVRDHARALSRNLDHAVDDDIDHIFALPALGHDLDDDLAHALDLTALDHDIDPALVRAQELTHNRYLDNVGIDRTLSDALIRSSALSSALVSSRDLDLTNALFRARTVTSLSSLTNINGDLARDLDRALDLAVARVLQSDRRCLEITRAGVGLLEACVALFRIGKRREFHQFLTEALADCIQVQPQGDPVAALRHAIEAPSMQGESLWVLALLANAQELIASPLNSDESAARDTVLAAALVLAAILAITGPEPPQDVSGDRNVDLLRGVLTTLIALTVPENQNQTVLLVKG